MRNPGRWKKRSGMENVFQNSCYFSKRKNSSYLILGHPGRFTVDTTLQQNTSASPTSLWGSGPSTVTNVERPSWNGVPRAWLALSFSLQEWGSSFQTLTFFPRTIHFLQTGIRGANITKYCSCSESPRRGKKLTFRRILCATWVSLRDLHTVFYWIPKRYEMCVLTLLLRRSMRLGDVHILTFT